MSSTSLSFASIAHLGRCRFEHHLFVAVESHIDLKLSKAAQTPGLCDGPLPAFTACTLLFKYQPLMRLLHTHRRSFEPATVLFNFPSFRSAFSCSPARAISSMRPSLTLPASLAFSKIALHTPCISCDPRSSAALHDSSASRRTCTISRNISSCFRSCSCSCFSVCFSFCFSDASSISSSERLSFSRSP